MDLRQDGLEIAVPNDFISEWIGKNFTRPIQEAAHEVLGGPLAVRFCVVPELFEVEGAMAGAPRTAGGTGEQLESGNGKTAKVKIAATSRAGVIRSEAPGAAAVVARTVAIVPGGARPTASFGGPSIG